MSVNKYRVYCNTDSKNEYVIASSGPTTCPVDAGHTIDADSVITVGGDVLINDGTPTDLSLADYKQLRYNEIDGKTMALISAGFVYDGQTFSASVPAQMNWNGLKTNESDFTWPVDITTKDNNEYSLTQANLTAFWTAGRDAVKGHIDTGRDLKKQVFDAVDEAAVDAVVDNR